MKFFNIRRNCYSSQSKGCWLFVQVGYTCFYFGKRKNPNKKQGLQIELFTPRQTMNKQGETVGYKRKGFGFRWAG